MEPTIIVEHVSKQYRTGTGLTNIRDLFSGKKAANSGKYHWAVKDLNFSLQPGEALGIIGPNGAGKTTTLKLLSQVTKPTSGQIRINGRMSALIELGAGFHPDLTGRDNVYLNGTILGMKRAEIKSRFDAIVEFAGIGEYLDTPVKRYSSGMYARLGFAIAAHVDPQILLVDEVLAVGDYAFQQRCYGRMDELRSNGTSLILVSHNMEAVRRVCEMGLVMYRGEDIFMGSSSEAVVAYSDALRESARTLKADVPADEGISQRVMTFDAEIENVRLMNAQGLISTVLESNKSARIILDVRFNKAVRDPIFSITVRTPDGRVVYDTTTRWMKIENSSFQPGERCQVEFEMDMCLLDGEYEVGADIAASNLSHLYDSMERALGFSIAGTPEAKGMANLNAKFHVIRAGETERA
ncbi:MAG: Vitamin B12 import ATP-binding protein BtuD [Anaerolineales bacterium]|nr:Vitamin B12 import ATP-binding protein BtuD [Anaerolineales bacterium]WKZ47758.1 MAG: ABC transporter ATP-binding protein [Anaerolineales bacterium]